MTTDDSTHQENSRNKMAFRFDLPVRSALMPVLNLGVQQWNLHADQANR
jgi:hypothetical protein